MVKSVKDGDRYERRGEAAYFVIMLTILALLVAIKMAQGESVSMKPDLDQIARNLGWTKGVIIEDMYDNGRPVWNAEARPGGQIVVSRAFYNESDLTTDEWAFVLAHEISHQALGHTSRGPLDHALNYKTLLGALIGYELAGKKGAGEVALAGFIFSRYRYSRKDETAADKAAVSMTAKSGYDPVAGASSLHKLQAHSGGSGKSVPIVGWLATHPATLDREANIRRWAERVRGQNPDDRGQKNPKIPDSGFQIPDSELQGKEFTWDLTVENTRTINCGSVMIVSRIIDRRQVDLMRAEVTGITNRFSDTHIALTVKVVDVYAPDARPRAGDKIRVE